MAAGGAPVSDGTASPLDRRVLQIWRIRGLVVAAAVLLASAVIAGAVVAAGVAVPAVLAVAVVVCAVAATLAIAWPKLSYDRWRYTVGAHTLELEHGVLYRTHSSVPWLRIQNVDVEQGPLERRLGIVSLVIRTASSSTDGTIPGIAEREAEELRQLILGRVGGGDAV